MNFDGIGFVTMNSTSIYFRDHRVLKPGYNMYLPNITGVVRTLFLGDSLLDNSWLRQFLLN